MLLDKTTDWTTIDAYVNRRPSLLRLVLARGQWLWLGWRAGAAERRRQRQADRFRDAARQLPAHVRRDLGLM